MLYTTFRLAKEAGACSKSYRIFAKHVGGIGKFGKDTPIPLTEVLEVLGLYDALWVLQCCTNAKSAGRINRLLSCDYAEHVLHIFEKKYPKDKSPRNAIETTREYLNGEATREEMDAARDAAMVAARDARDAAWAAGAAAGDAAWAARDAAGAARDAAYAARDAAGDAAWAARDAAGAARDAAYVARAAARDAAYAARAAAYAARAAAGDAARDAGDAGDAGDAEKKWQTEKFIEVLKE